jgi:hypothetical protein
MLASVSDQHPSRHLVLRFSENEKVREAERQQAQTGKQLWMRVRRGQAMREQARTGREREVVGNLVQRKSRHLPVLLSGNFR